MSLFVLSYGMMCNSFVTLSSSWLRFKINYFKTELKIIYTMDSLRIELKNREKIVSAQGRSTFDVLKYFVIRNLLFQYKNTRFQWSHASYVDWWLITALIRLTDYRKKQYTKNTSYLIFTTVCHQCIAFISVKALSNWH